MAKGGMSASGLLVDVLLTVVQVTMMIDGHVMIMRTMKNMLTMIARPDHRLPLRCAQLPGLQVPRQGLHSGNIGRLLSADVLSTILSRFADC